MKLFPLLLTGALLVPSAALANNNNNGNGCRNRCATTNNIDSDYNYDYEGTERRAPVAPLPIADSVGRVGDVVVPLPNVGFGGFTSTRTNGEMDYGVSVGVRVPLGAGQFRDAARDEARRRTDRAEFRLIQEAVWLRDQGILNEEGHPRHWAALYGAPETFKF